MIFQSLLSNVAFGFGCSYMARYEEQGVGIQWHNIAYSPIPDDKYSMLGTILMLIVDSIVYAILTWYIEVVFPGKEILSVFCIVWIICILFDYLFGLSVYTHVYNSIKALQ